MKKFIHKIAIDYPIVSAFIVFMMCYSLYLLSSFNKIDSYVEATGKVVQEKDAYVTSVEVDKAYYDGIKENDKVIWYADLDSAVYSGEMLLAEVSGDKCVVKIKIDGDNLNNEIQDGRNRINVKMSYKRDTVLKHLLSEH